MNFSCCGVSTRPSRLLRKSTMMSTTALTTSPSPSSGLLAFTPATPDNSGSAACADSGVRFFLFLLIPSSSSLSSSSLRSCWTIPWCSGLEGGDAVGPASNEANRLFASTKAAKVPVLYSQSRERLRWAWLCSPVNCVCAVRTQTAQLGKQNSMHVHLQRRNIYRPRPEKHVITAL